MKLERITNIAELSDVDKAKKAVENLPEWILEDTKLKIERVGKNTLVLLPEEKRGVLRIKEGATNIRVFC